MAAEFSNLPARSQAKFRFGVPNENFHSWHSGVGNGLGKLHHQHLGDPSGLEYSRMDTINLLISRHSSSSQSHIAWPLIAAGLFPSHFVATFVAMNLCPDTVGHFACRAFDVIFY